MFRLVPLLASIAIATSAHAACTAQSGKDSPHLVELYTSEGCSSCPPAEKWMSSLVPKPGFVGLEFHVDYWDSPAWRDPFDSKSYTQRQEMLDKGVKGAQPYTPQIWLDGQLWNNWPKGAPPAPYSGAQPTVQVEANVADSIKAHVTTTGVAHQPATLCRADGKRPRRERSRRRKQGQDAGARSSSARFRRSVRQGASRRRFEAARESQPR